MRRASLYGATALLLVVSGCTTTVPALDPTVGAERRADVNPGYRAGGIGGSAASAPSLQQVLSGTPQGRVQTVREGEDRLRAPAMQEAALAYGARAGLARATADINRTLEARSRELATTYDFQRLMIKGPDGVMVVPPVISEARDTWESFDAGRTLRVADTVYEIIEQSVFTSVAPMWQTYLITQHGAAETPPNALLPRDKAERETWNAWVAQGFAKGEEQAQEAFESNLARLQRDFTGMVRYRQLLEEGKVSAPVLAEGRLGVTGSGQDMRVNDRAVRITQDPTLRTNSSEWGASATGRNGAGDAVGAPPAPTPAAKETPRSAAPTARAQPARATPPPARTQRSAAPRTASPPRPTSGGEGRF